MKETRRLSGSRAPSRDGWDRPDLVGLVNTIISCRLHLSLHLLSSHIPLPRHSPHVHLFQERKPLSRGLPLLYSSISFSTQLYIHPCQHAPCLFHYLMLQLFSIPFPREHTYRWLLYSPAFHNRAMCLPTSLALTPSLGMSLTLVEVMTG